MREAGRLVEGTLDVSPQVLEKLLRRDGVRCHEANRELQVDREGDEVLLHAVVQLVLERATLGVSREHEPLPAGPELGDLEAQLFGRLP
jgi:hypothetical protein